MCFDGWGGENCEWLVPVGEFTSNLPKLVIDGVGSDRILVMADCVGNWSKWGVYEYNGTFGEYGNWTDCNATCGGGYHDRNYTVSVPAFAGGAECADVHGDNETQDCNMEACPEPEPEPEPEPTGPPPPPTAAGSQATDKAALLAAKTDNNRILSWSPATSPCDPTQPWSGIRCHIDTSTGRVVMVTIEPATLTSTVQIAAFADLHALIYLNLNGNVHVRGDLSALSGMDELRFLDLRSKFASKLPSW